MTAPAASARSSSLANRAAAALLSEALFILLWCHAVSSEAFAHMASRYALVMFVVILPIALTAVLPLHATR